MSDAWTGDWLRREPVRKAEAERYGEMPQSDGQGDLTSESSKNRIPRVLRPNTGPMPLIGAFQPLVDVQRAWTGDWLGKMGHPEVNALEASATRAWMADHGMVVKYSDDQARDPDGKWTGGGAAESRAHGGDHGGPGHTIEHTSYAADGKFRQVPFSEADKGSRATHMQMEHGDRARTGPISSIAHDAAHARTQQAATQHMARANRASDNDLAGHLTEHHDVHSDGGSTMAPGNAAALAAQGRARLDDIHGSAHGIKKYSDDQDRGDNGQWTCGIDGCGSEQISAESLAEHQQHEHEHPGRLTAGRDLPDEDDPSPKRKYSDEQDRGEDGKWVPMGGGDSQPAGYGVGHHFPDNSDLRALHGAMRDRTPLNAHRRDQALHHLSDAHGVYSSRLDARGVPLGNDDSIHGAHANAHRAGMYAKAAEHDGGRWTD